MEKRLPRQRLQRIAIVPPPPPAKETEILIELDEGTLRGVDSLVERVKAGDVSPAFAAGYGSIRASSAPCTVGSALPSPPEAGNDDPAPSLGRGLE